MNYFTNFRNYIQDLKRQYTPRRYGVNINVGEFGAGKTYHTFKSAYNSYKNGDFIIGNIPYDFVHLKYSSNEDMKKVFKFLLFYILYTNVEIDGEYLFLKQNNKFRPIHFVVDEMHLYRNPRRARNFKDYMMTVLTQCRKRNIYIDVISQDLSKVEKTFRIYVRDVRKWFKGMRYITFHKDFYLKTNDSTDLQDEDTAVEKGNILFNLHFGPMVHNFFARLFGFDDVIRKYYDKKYLSYYVTGSEYIFDTKVNIFDVLDKVYTNGFFNKFGIDKETHLKIMDKVKKNNDMNKFKGFNFKYNRNETKKKKVKIGDKFL